MREITVVISQNVGTAAVGSQYKVYTTQIADLADISQVLDGKNSLTKVTPGTLTCKVVDLDGSLWRFLSSQLSLIPGITGWQPSTVYLVGTTVMCNGNAYVCTRAGLSSAVNGDPGPTGTGTDIFDGGCMWDYTQPSGFLPPWIEVYVGGTRVFLGNIDTAQVVQRESATDNLIEIAAYSWEKNLSNIYLGSPTGMPWIANTRYAVGDEVLNGGSSYICVQAGTSGPNAGPVGIARTIPDGTVVWAFVAPTWRRQAPSHAVNFNGVQQSGYSQSNAAYIHKGLYANTIYIDNDTNGFAVGTTISTTRPVLNMVAPGTGQGLPSLDKYQYGYEAGGGGHQ